jgi:UDP-N-acetylglucosamine acyltransferase
MTDIHASAIVGEAVKLGSGVAIGPYCVVDGEVTLGDGVTLHSHAVVTGRTEVGAGTTVFPFVAIGHRPQDLKYAGEPSTISIGRNCTLRENVTVHPGTAGGGMHTSVGDGCLLMAGIHVAHDCHVGNNVIIANGTGLAGHVQIGDHATLGGMVGAHQFIRIGRHAFVGGMSKLVRDVMPFALVEGSPAAMIGLNVVGLKRHGFTREDIQVLKSAYALLFAGEGTLQGRAAEIAGEFAGNALVGDILAFLQGNSPRGFTLPKNGLDGPED